MCSEALRKKSYQLQYVPDSLEIQEMCMKAVGKGPLADIPDWFVDLKLVEMWHDEEDYCNEFAE